jgi:hypothetical protein
LFGFKNYGDGGKILSTGADSSKTFQALSPTALKN